MSINRFQLTHLIAKTIQAQGLYSRNALHLLLLTSAQETHLGTYLRQWPHGPGRGIFSMEPIAERDIWERCLLVHDYRRRALTRISGVFSMENNGAMEWNLAYQICMCRLHYLLVPDPLPDYEDVRGMACYWDHFYNKNPKKGFPEEAMLNYRRYVLGQR